MSHETDATRWDLAGSVLADPAGEPPRPAPAAQIDHGPAHAPAHPLDQTLERMSGMAAATRAAIRSRAFWQRLPDATPVPGAEGPDIPGAPDSFAIGLEAPCDRFLDDLQLAPGALRRSIAHRLDALARRYGATAEAPPQRVLVVGAGPVGLRCAIGAALAGHQVTVLERYGRETRARYLGLFAPEQHFLAELGAPRSMFVELPSRGCRSGWSPSRTCRTTCGRSRSSWASSSAGARAPRSPRATSRRG